jgi:hypothetical protein
MGPTLKKYILKTSVFWDITPYSPLNISQRFRGDTKRLLIYNVLHSVISRKTELFITTAVRTSNPKYMFRLLICCCKNY